MLRIPRPIRSRGAAIAFLFSLAALAGAQDSAAAAGCASALIEAESLEAVLDSKLGPSARIGLRIDADAEAAEARGFLELGSEGSGGPALKLGPGAPAGILRFIIDPASAAALSPSEPVAIDRSMEAGRAALGVGTEGLSAFAIGEAEGRLLALRRSGIEGPPAGAEGEGSARPAAAAAGVSMRASGAGLDWAAEADSSWRGADEGGGGWSPDPRPDSGGAVAHAALLARRAWGSGSSSAALAASAGRTDGAGLAARVQARGSAGPISLNVSIGAASPAYRGLFGEPPDDAFRCRAEAVLALRRSSRLAAALESFAERSGGIAAPRGGSSGSLSCTLAVAEGLSVAAAATARKEAGDGPGAASGPGSAEIGIRISRSSEGPRGGSVRSRIGASASLKRDAAGTALDEVELAAELDVENGGGWPSQSMRLAASLPGGSRTEAVIKGSLEIGIPLEGGALLSLRLGLPSEGVKLVPLPEGAEAPSPEISIAYRVPLGSP